MSFHLVFTTTVIYSCLRIFFSQKNKLDWQAHDTKKLGLKQNNTRAPAFFDRSMRQHKQGSLFGRHWKLHTCLHVQVFVNMPEMDEWKLIRVNEPSCYSFMCVFVFVFECVCVWLRKKLSKKKTDRIRRKTYPLGHNEFCFPRKRSMTKRKKQFRFHFFILLFRQKMITLKAIIEKNPWLLCVCRLQGSHKNYMLF